MNRYKTSSRKLLKFPRKFLFAASAPTSESSAVKPTVTTRSPRVGRTLRNASTAVISVREPTVHVQRGDGDKPGRGQDQHDGAEAGEHVVPDLVQLADAGAVEVLARPGGQHRPDDHHPAATDR